MPLATTIKQRLNLTISNAFEKFRTGPDQVSFEAIFQMIAFFMGFELLHEEKMAMEGYLDAFG